MRKNGGGDFHRADRVASEIREIMALIVTRFSKEPRLSRGTITRVSMSADLRNATVFFTVFPGDDPEQYQEYFDRNRGALRKELASRIRIKYIPGLIFVHDSHGSEEERIERLLKGQLDAEEE
jgi:ribosome-binding factor A